MVTMAWDRGQSVADRTHLARESWHDPGGRDGRRADGRCRARIPREAAVIHGGRQHRAHIGVDVAGIAAPAQSRSATSSGTTFEGYQHQTHRYGRKRALR